MGGIIMTAPQLDTRHAPASRPHIAAVTNHPGVTRNRAHGPHSTAYVTVRTAARIAAFLTVTAAAAALTWAFFAGVVIVARLIAG